MAHKLGAGRPEGLILLISLSRMSDAGVQAVYKLDVESRKLRALESRRGPGL